jgi:dTDP-4-amino-4,6-dideoxygalactose transaminase
MIPRYAPTYNVADLLGALRAADPLARLRAELGERYGAKHVFLFRAGRSALAALLQAHGRPGAVVTPTYNCIAVPEAVTWAGCRPAFADIGPGSINMTPETLQAAITPETTAVLLTHQFGIPCDIDAMLAICRAHGLLAIEDAAPAIGARTRDRLVGTIGDAAIISFHRTKVIAGGDGGALLLDDDALAARVATLVGAQDTPGSAAAAGKALAWAGVMHPAAYSPLHWLHARLRGDVLFEVVTPESAPPDGLFATCAPFTAALVSAQWPRLEANLARRRRLAAIYQAELAGVPGIGVPEVAADAAPAWIQFPIFVTEKAQLYRRLLRRGIDLSWTFRYSCADSYPCPPMPNARRAAESVLGLPTYPRLTDAAAECICAAITQCASSASSTPVG